MSRSEVSNFWMVRRSDPKKLIGRLKFLDGPEVGPKKIDRPSGVRSENSIGTWWSEFRIEVRIENSIGRGGSEIGRGVRIGVRIENPIGRGGSEPRSEKMFNPDPKLWNTIFMIFIDFIEIYRKLEKIEKT